MKSLLDTESFANTSNLEEELLLNLMLGNQAHLWSQLLSRLVWEEHLSSGVPGHLGNTVSPGLY
jgi:hypothetical protein